MDDIESLRQLLIIVNVDMGMQQPWMSLSLLLCKGSPVLLIACIVFFAKVDKPAEKRADTQASPPSISKQCTWTPLD